MSLLDFLIARLTFKSATILEFPSVDLGVDQEIGSVRQATSVTGELIRVGGETEFDQILLRDVSGTVVAGCFATKEIGKKLAMHLHEYVRLHGIASWHRDRHGKWQMMRMKVQTFEKVDNQSLSEALAAVQAAVVDWPDDLADQLLSMRGGEAA